MACYSVATALATFPKVTRPSNWRRTFAGRPRLPLLAGPEAQQSNICFHRLKAYLLLPRPCLDDSMELLPLDG
jgi:hypothetical protein